MLNWGIVEREMLIDAHNMISSARFPMLMFRSALAVSPRSWQSLSVANVSVIDNGTIAIKFKMKMIIEGASASEMMIAATGITKESMILGSSSSLPWQRNANAGCSQIRQSNVVQSACLGELFRKIFFSCWESLSTPCRVGGCSLSRYHNQHHIQRTSSREERFTICFTLPSTIHMPCVTHETIILNFRCEIIGISVERACRLI